MHKGVSEWMINNKEGKREKERCDVSYWKMQTTAPQMPKPAIQQFHTEAHVCVYININIYPSQKSQIWSSYDWHTQN